jgi:manganese transport protein
VRQVFQIALGILAAIGGFVDIGDLVFATQAGAVFGYQLLWAVVLGVIGIVVYAEMSGRVAGATQRPVMEAVRQRLGFGTGLAALIAAQVLSLLTLTAEVGGIAVVLRLLLDLPYHLFLPFVVGALLVIIWFLPFGWIERVFGYLGLCLLVFVAAAIHLHPDWSSVGNGFVPSVSGAETARYGYFVVGVIAAALMPYEVYFYSSGVIEERWTTSDLRLNRLNAMLGFGLGGLLSIGLVMTAAQLFHPAGVEPEFLGTVALGANISFGEVGLVLAIIGMLFAIGGAAIDTALAGAYNIAQYLGWEWGKYRRPGGAPRFTVAWLVMLALAFVIVSTGVDPVLVTEYSVVLSVVALPLTYLPVLLVARDPAFMGEHANGRLANALGWIYLVIITVVAFAAVPLILATNAGSPS